MSSYILCQGEFLRNYLVYRAQISELSEIVIPFQYSRNFILLASSDNDKPMLMRQKCKQGFAYRDELFCFLFSSGAIGQLLDSLEEIQVLTGASDADVNFLQNFFEHQTLQALLEVRSLVDFCVEVLTTT